MRTSFSLYLIYFLLMSPVSFQKRAFAERRVYYPNHRLNLVRVGKPESRLEGRAVEILRHRVQRWLGRLEGVSLDVILGKQPFPRERLEAERERARLYQLSESILEGLQEGEDLQLLERQMRSLFNFRQKAVHKWDWGPLWQRILLAEGITLWKRGKRKQAEKSLKNALALHPEGKWESGIAWEWDVPGLNIGELEELLHGLIARQVRTCIYDLSVDLSVARVTVNGFPVKTNRLSLVTGVKYQIEVSAPKYWVYRKGLSCQMAKKQALSIRLKPIAEQPSLVPVTESMTPVLLIEAKEGWINLFLWSRQRGLDPIALEQPLSVREILVAPMDLSVPILEEAFVKHWLEHVPLPQPIALPMGNGVGKGVGLAKENPAKAPEWYNNWVFWSILGGVLGVGGLVWLASQDAGSPPAVARTRVRGRVN